MKRGRGRPPGKSNAGRALRGLERAEAIRLAQELLAHLIRKERVILMIQERTGCSELASRRIVAEAEEILIRDTVSTDAPKVRARMLAAAEALFADAWKEKKFSAATEVLKLLFRANGLDEGRAPALVVVGADMAERTDAELAFAAAHGFFPDEAPEDMIAEGSEVPALPAKVVDPFEAL